jgi:hypothetical protein
MDINLLIINAMPAKICIAMYAKPVLARVKDALQAMEECHQPVCSAKLQIVTIAMEITLFALCVILDTI